MTKLCFYGIHPLIVFLQARARRTAYQRPAIFRRTDYARLHVGLGSHLLSPARQTQLNHERRTGTL